MAKQKLVIGKRYQFGSDKTTGRFKGYDLYGFPDFDEIKDNCGYKFIDKEETTIGFISYEGFKEVD